MTRSGRLAGQGWRSSAATLAAAVLLPRAAAAAAPYLMYDASGTHPTSTTDGNGVWNLPGNAVWSNGGTTDVPWTDGSFADFGSGTGTAPYTISLVSNVTADGVEFDPVGTGASYTVNAQGYTVNVPTGNLLVLGSITTLTNGTFTTGDATGNNPGGVNIQYGGVLTVGPGATLATAAINGDLNGYASTIYFNGATLRALSNPAGATKSFVLLGGTSAAYLSAGGLTIDTSAVSTGISYVTSALTHDPSVAGSDAGLTVTGGGTLQLGMAQQYPGPSNPVNTYTGPTAVAANTTLRLDTAGGTTAVTGSAGTGPFPNSRFTVAAGGTLAVAATDAVVGETGTTPVTITGGTLALVGGVSAHLANLTLNGGTVTADASGGRFTFVSGAELHATAAGTATSASLAFDSGSDVRTDSGVVLTLSSPLVDGDTAGQLTAVGSGSVVLGGTGTYTGPTNVSGGTVTLAPGGSLTGTPAIAVAAKASLVVNGTIASAPTLTAAGTVTFGPLSTTGIGVRTLGATTITAGGTVAVAASATAATRTLLVVPSLTFTNASSGHLDMGNGDLRITNSSTAAAATTLAAVTAATATGYAGGAWTGPGLASTAAAADSLHLTALGVIQNTTGSTPLYATFDGQPAAATDVLVRYTYYGDTNLDGKVNLGDYTRVDAGFIGHLTGWVNGDFNYDGVVDGSDYTLMDNAFNQQNNAVGAPAAGSAASALVLSDPLAVLPAVAVVPEPATPFLVAIAGLTLSATRFRRRDRTIRGQPSRIAVRSRSVPPA